MSENTDYNKKFVPDDLQMRYEFYNYGHALEILNGAYQTEWSEVCDCLRKLNITKEDLLAAGGNETQIPKKFDDVLYPYGWREIRISADLTIKKYPRQTSQRRGKFASEPFETETITSYIDGHNIDFLKNKVAFDLEWNSKDQTFDRDLMAFRTYYECRLVDVGIIITRSEDLNQVFKALDIMAKYGASTTWMGKLLPRLESRRNGGCPVLAVGIKKECIELYERLTGYSKRFSEIHKR